jgi:glycosyltransferase involved in cell wall biosynthesis
VTKIIHSLIHDSTLPTVSVIIPTYQNERFIIRTIESVLDQTYPYFEIIIIDDASTDNTRELITTMYISEINNGKIIYHQNDKNMERVFSRNKGAELAKGEYLLFIDHDDLLSDNAIDKFIYTMQKKNVEFVTQSLKIIIDENDNIIAKRKIQYFGSVHFKIFFNLAPFSCITIKNQLFLISEVMIVNWKVKK